MMSHRGHMGLARNISAGGDGPALQTSCRTVWGFNLPRAALLSTTFDHATAARHCCCYLCPHWHDLLRFLLQRSAGESVGPSIPSDMVRYAFPSVPKWGYGSENITRYGATSVGFVRLLRFLTLRRR